MWVEAAPPFGPDLQAVPGDPVRTFRWFRTDTSESRLGGVTGGIFEHTDELDRMRMLLFADLSPEEGWAEIERAMLGSLVEAYWRRLEETLGTRYPIEDLRTADHDRAGRQSSQT